MKPILALAALIAAAAATTAWIITAPERLPAIATAGLAGEAARGEAVFHAAGCASCHMAPGATGAAQLVLSGGQSFPTDFGTFIAPNISPDPQAGIGGWTLAQFADAVMRGVSPDGRHYYPAFPYAAYRKMELADLADLKAFMDSLPADATPSQPHDIGFPFNLRRGLGLWKAMFVTDDWALPDPLSPEATRGRYLAEALAHCAECHTPRNALGGLDRSAWLAGAPNPSGRGTIPALTPEALDWSAEEIATYLTTGFTPDYDSAGGHMVHVVENFARLPESEAQAVAAYLKALRPR